MIRRLIRRLSRAEPAADELAAARPLRSGGLGALQPYNPDDLVQGKGLEIYDRMQTDSQVSATLATKKLSVLSGGWSVQPASFGERDVEAAELCRFALAQVRGCVETLLFSILDALAKGYAIAEINFRIIERGRWKGKIGLDSVKHKDPSLFAFECDEFLNLKSLVRLADPDRPETRLPRSKFIVYSYMPTYEDPHGRSDLRSCYKHWWAKELILRFFCAYLERFGAPVLKGTYKRGATRQHQDDLLRILRDIQHETAIVVPEDISVELLEAAFHGEQGFLDAIAYHDRQIAKAILGETLTQEEGSRTGALALARVHQETLLLRLRAIKRDLEETVMREQLLRPLTELNFEDAGPPRFLLGSLEDRDTGALSSALERLVKMGAVEAGEPWIRPWLGLPERTDPARKETQEQ